MTRYIVCSLFYVLKRIFI